MVGVVEVAIGAGLVASPVPREALVLGVALVADAAAGVNDPLGDVVMEVFILGL